MRKISLDKFTTSWMFTRYLNECPVYFIQTARRKQTYAISKNIKIYKGR